MSFVNIHGQPIDLASLQTKRATKTTSARESTHKGFQAVGYSPEQIAEARLNHKRDSEFRVSGGRTPLPEFSVDSYARKAKPKKIEKPKATREAAATACAIAERAGWVKTSVVELVKGGRQ